MTTDGETLQRLEAMVLSLRDQVDRLADRLEAQLKAQRVLLRTLEGTTRRIEADVGELTQEASGLSAVVHAAPLAGRE